MKTGFDEIWTGGVTDEHAHHLPAQVNCFQINLGKEKKDFFGLLPAQQKTCKICFPYKVMVM